MMIRRAAYFTGRAIAMTQPEQKTPHPSASAVLSDVRAWAERVRAGDLAARLPVSMGEYSGLARDINAIGQEFESLAQRLDERAQSHAVRLARKTRSLDILHEIAAGLNQPGGLEQILDGFLDTLMDLVDARAASVRLLTADDQARLVASRGLAPAVTELDRARNVTLDPGGWTAHDGKIHIQPGTGHYAALIGRPYLEPDCVEFVAVPIVYHGRTLGVYNLFLDNPVASLGDDAHELLISIGRHLGLAIEKTRLDHDARRLAIMEERNILGSELHDSLAQSLVGLRLQVKMLGETLHKRDLRTAQDEVRRLRAAIEEAHASLRVLLANFRLKIDERGLAPAIAGMIERFRAETGIAVFFQNECAALNLTAPQEIQVFYIIQEALTNIRKHSSARNVRVLLNNEDDLYTVLIEDDGLGMADVDADATGPSTTPTGEHLGLAVMRERARRLPGELVIESEPGEGTRLVLIFTGSPPVVARIPSP